MGFCWLVRDVIEEQQRDAALVTLRCGEETRLRAHTTELTATVRVQAALIAQERTARDQAAELVRHYPTTFERVAADVGSFLRAVGADDTAIAQVVDRLTSEMAAPAGV